MRPFCEVVVNEETSGPVTGQAIFALDKFLASGLFGMLPRDEGVQFFCPVHLTFVYNLSVGGRIKVFFVYVFVCLSVCMCLCLMSYIPLIFSDCMSSLCPTSNVMKGKNCIKIHTLLDTAVFFMG